MDSRSNRVSHVDLSKEHGALGQALIYTAGDLINCLARRGIEERSVEILVFSGRKQNREGNQRLCFVRGCLDIPEFCGKTFYYSVKEVGSYDEENAEKRGLAAYFHTLSNGIERALRATNNPTPLCGRIPRVVDCDMPEWSLVGSPIPRVRLDYAVSQGERFRTYLSSVLPANDISIVWMADCREKKLQDIQQHQEALQTIQDKLTALQGTQHNQAVLQEIQQNKASLQEIKEKLDALDFSVLIKFGCHAAHQHFVPPSVAFDSLSLLYTVKDLRDTLSDVLLGVWGINQTSVVTITRDLTNQFSPARPQDLHGPGALRNPWDGFIRLNEELLIPMAIASLVHADLRPGWNESANILRHQLENGTEELKLIDYESICRIADVPENNEFKTFSSGYDDKVNGDEYIALRHLWWQCMFTAYTWAMQLNVGEDNYDARSFVRDFQSRHLDQEFLGTEDDRAQLEEFEEEQNISDAIVRRTLHILRKLPSFTQ